MESAGGTDGWRAVMKGQAVLVAVLGLMLASCVGVYGPKGNDVGGIIPWSPEAELAALDIAQANCGRFNKYAAITSVHRVYGDYISYACWWKPPYRSYRHVYR
jgi:hypothetical protein